jgi:hypothetical protein
MIDSIHAAIHSSLREGEKKGIKAKNTYLMFGPNINEQQIHHSLFLEIAASTGRAPHYEAAVC